MVSPVTTAISAVSELRAEYDMKWVDSAKCRGMDPNDFHPIKSDPYLIPKVKAAKAFCQGCPVIHDCLLYAVSTMEEVGVWGGKSAKERRAFRRMYVKGEWPTTGVPHHA